MRSQGDAEYPELPVRAHQDLVALLAEVDAVLAETTEDGTAYLLYTVGGFAMGRGSASRLTQDIDVATAIPAPVSAAAAEVAARHGMNPAWLNDQVSEMIQAQVSADRFVEIYRGRHLIVYGADDELMLALKLMSGRPRDIGDIVDLALQTQRTTADDLLDAWDSVYDGVPGADPQRHYVRSVVQDDVMPELRRRGTASGGMTSAGRESARLLTPPTPSAASSRGRASSARGSVVCGQHLGGKRSCGRKLRDAPCPHHPNSPGSGIVSRATHK